MSNLYPGPEYREPKAACSKASAGPLAAMERTGDRLSVSAVVDGEPFTIIEGETARAA